MDADYFNNHYYPFAEKPNPVEYKNVYQVKKSWKLLLVSDL